MLCASLASRTQLAKDYAHAAVWLLRDCLASSAARAAQTAFRLDPSIALLASRDAAILFNHQPHGARDHDWMTSREDEDGGSDPDSSDFIHLEANDGKHTSQSWDKAISQLQREYGPMCGERARSVLKGSGGRAAVLWHHQDAHSSRL